MQGTGSLLIQWLGLSIPFSAIFFPAADVKTVGTDSVESLTPGAGGSIASLQKGTLSLSSIGTKTQMFKVQNTWNHLASVGISLMMSLKVSRSILIQQ